MGNHSLPCSSLLPSSSSEHEVSLVSLLIFCFHAANLKKARSQLQLNCAAHVSAFEGQMYFSWFPTQYQFFLGIPVSKMLPQSIL